MEHKNLIGHDGAVHEGLLNSHTGFLIDVACDAGRYSVVHHYEHLDPARVTDAPLSCPACVAANSPATAHLHRGSIAHRYAEDVLALADTRERPPAQDDEGLRLAFVALAVENPPPRSLYALIREHVVDTMTDRALAVPEGVPEVFVPYKRYTGGTVQAPVGPGDRLMHYSAAAWVLPVRLGRRARRVSGRNRRHGPREGPASRHLLGARAQPTVLETRPSGAARTTHRRALTGPHKSARSAATRRRRAGHPMHYCGHPWPRAGMC